MLTDDNIWTALQMLKKQFPKMGGLQNPVLGTILQFTVASGRFVQILHDGNLHWVTVATPPPLMAADVILYDSLNDRVNSHCEKQISSLLSRKSTSVRCVVDTSQRQSGVTDCGLFAIAAATSCCFGEFSSGRYEQAAMRGHFRGCIQRGVMTPFPTTVTANHPATRRPDAVSPATRHPDAVSPATHRPDAVSPATRHPDAVSPATRHPDAVSPATRRPDAVSPATRCPDAVSPATRRPDAVSPATRRPDAVSPATRHPDTFSAEDTLMCHTGKRLDLVCNCIIYICVCALKIIMYK